MQPAVSRASGNRYELVQRGDDTMSVQLMGCQFVATPGDVTIEIPAELWEAIRQHGVRKMGAILPKDVK